MPKIASRRAGNRRTAAGVANEPRGLVIRPPPERKWLLRGTSLAGGVLAMMLLAPRPALALPCTQVSTNQWDCVEDDTGFENFTPISSPSFLFQLGPNDTPYTQHVTVFSPGSPAFVVNLFNAVDGTIHIFENSFIHTRTANEDGGGLQLNYSEDD